MTIHWWYWLVLYYVVGLAVAFWTIKLCKATRPIFRYKLRNKDVVLASLIAIEFPVCIFILFFGILTYIFDNNYSDWRKQPLVEKKEKINSYRGSID